MGLLKKLCVYHTAARALWGKFDGLGSLIKHFCPPGPRLGARVGISMKLAWRDN